MDHYTAHLDTFVRERIPDESQLPVFLYDLPKLTCSGRLNAVNVLLDRQIRAGFGDKIAIVSDGESWSYDTLHQVVNRICHVLVTDAGLVPGNRVLLRAPNTPWLAACWLAVLKVGGIAVTTMPLLRSRELIPILNKAKIELAICDRRLLDELITAQAEVSVLKRVICCGNEHSQAELQELMATKSGEYECVGTAHDDPALIAFTSGTTGVPKGCVHTHAEVLAMGHCFSEHVLQPTGDDVFTGSPPLAFTFGLGALLVFPLLSGATTVLLENGSPRELAAAIARHRATICFTSPTGYRGLLAVIDENDLSSLRKTVSAGEHLPLSTFDAWLEATGIAMIDGLGATEMMHIFVSAAGDDIRPGATGLSVPGYRVCILGDDNQPLPPGSTGRLAVKGPTGCRYLDDARQRNYVINGWNVTGDTYRQDIDGYFWFIGRDDDMIISSGYNISGQEVEDVLLAHESVSECAVVAVPDVHRGHIPKAYITLAARHEPSSELVAELQAWVKTHIAPYKYPREIEFVASLPKTETGKIQRFKLRQ